MAITGAQFTNVPHGTLTPVLHGDTFSAPFEVRAAFTSGDGDFAAGEYRQYVKGVFTIDDVAAPHSLCGSVMLSPDIFREDGCPYPICTAYGHRVCPSPLDYYKPTQANGNLYFGQDAPGLTSSTGSAVAIDLTFLGQLIDTSQGGRVLASATWRVFGSTVIMETILAASSQEQTPEGETVTATAKPIPGGGGWEVGVLISRPPGRPRIAGDDVEVDVRDASGAVLPIVSGPAALLDEVGGSRRVTAFARFVVEGSGGGTPATVEAKVRGRSFTFVIGPPSARPATDTGPGN